MTGPLTTLATADPGTAELLDALGVVFLGEWQGTDHGLAAAADAILDRREADWWERERRELTHWWEDEPKAVGVKWRGRRTMQVWCGAMESSEERRVA